MRRGAEARRRVGAKTRGGAPARLRAFATTLIALGASASVASACPVCFGGPNSLTTGMNSAIFFLIGIVALVQIGFVALFWSFRRRAKELQRHREQFHVINGGVR